MPLVDRGIWVKSKCLNREEFVVVGWTDLEGSRSHIGALLLGYYTQDGGLHYAGRGGYGADERADAHVSATPPKGGGVTRGVRSPPDAPPSQLFE